MMAAPYERRARLKAALPGISETELDRAIACAPDTVEALLDRLDLLADSLRLVAVALEQAQRWAALWKRAAKRCRKWALAAFKTLDEETKA